jgi:hypothetical protein
MTFRRSSPNSGHATKIAGFVVWLLNGVCNGICSLTSDSIDVKACLVRCAVKDSHCLTGGSVKRYSVAYCGLKTIHLIKKMTICNFWFWGSRDPAIEGIRSKDENGDSI